MTIHRYPPLCLLAIFLLLGCGATGDKHESTGDVQLAFSGSDADGAALEDGLATPEDAASLDGPSSVAPDSFVAVDVTVLPDQAACQSDCTGKECGYDGCDGLCGQCSFGEYCAEGICKPGECQPDCTGKQCGDNGCGGLCGQCEAKDACQVLAGCIQGACQYVPTTCDDGDICTKDTCDPNSGCQSVPDSGPCSWPGNWHFEAENPILSPSAGAQPEGADNIYAPDILYFQSQWWMFYGGQGSDGHDAIFVARSNDLVHWQKHPSPSNPQPVVDHGTSNHVNDPSVVSVGGTLYMYYTEAPTGEEDEVHLATSTDGLNWTKQGKVLDVGPPGSWESDRVGRPSVLHEKGEFRMWYDGQIYGVARHVGYATSNDGYTWTKYAGNPIVQHEGAVDVDRVGDWYVLLSEGGEGTYQYIAKDPLNWHSLGLLWSKSGKPWDKYGQVTPFLLTIADKAVAIYFGAASDSCWCKNRIAMAWPNDDTCQPNCQGAECGPDGCGGSCGSCGDGKTCTAGQCESGPEGCTGCLVGASSCKEACQGAGKKGGWCDTPGSTNPDECCACEDWGPCEQCLDGYANCKEACQHSGYPGGHCAAPDSTDPTECCACDPDTGCEGCLVGASSCMEACQGAGLSYGWCAEPGSQNPSACCACL
jgi:hypothetical protein